eukprot:3177929-Pyramimonas_sp.AAC.1
MGRCRRRFAGHKGATASTLRCPPLRGKTVQGMNLFRVEKTMRLLHETKRKKGNSSGAEVGRPPRSKTKKVVA